MSRFTGLQGGQRSTLLDPTRRGGTRGADDRVGLPQGIQAVNLPTAPVVPNTLASEFVATMRAVAGSANTVGAVATDIQDARNRQEANEILLQSETALPDLFTAIDEGRMGGQSAEQITDSLIAGASTQVVADTVRGRLQPRIAQRIERADRAAAEELRVRGVTNAARVVQTATTAEQVQESLVALGDFARDDSERQVLEQSALLEGLQASALAGDRGGFEMFDSLLPEDVQPVRRQQFANQLGEQERKAQGQLNEAVSQEVYGALNDGDFLRAETILRERGDTITPSTVRGLRGVIESETERAASVLDTEAWLGGIRDEYVTPSLLGETSPIRIGDLAGSTVNGVKVPQEVADAFINEAANQIIEQQGTVGLQEWMVREGVNVVPALERQMNVPSAGIDIDNGTVSDGNADSFLLWREFGNRDIGNAHIDNNLRAVHTLAEKLFAHNPQGEDDTQKAKNALLQAKRAIEYDGDRKAISDVTMRSATPGWVKDVRNRETIEAVAKSLAWAYQGNGQDADHAIDAAFDHMKDDYIVVDGWASFKGNLNTQHDVVKGIESGVLPQAIVGTYISENETREYRAKDLTIARPTGMGVWMVVDRKTGFPVPGSAAFTEEELAQQLADANVQRVLKDITSSLSKQSAGGGGGAGHGRVGAGQAFLRSLPLALREMGLTTDRPVPRDNRPQLGENVGAIGDQEDIDAVTRYVEGLRNQ